METQILLAILSLRRYTYIYNVNKTKSRQKGTDFYADYNPNCHDDCPAQLVYQ